MQRTIGDKSLAIAIISFDRPEYLKQVMEGLVLNELEGIEIYLFQDNHTTVNNVQVTEPQNVYNCLSVFSSYFPQGNIYFQDTNLGVALQFDFAEKLLFREKKYDRIIFFEDDLVPQPNYLSTLKYMFNKYSEDPRVAAVAAYGGSPRSTLEIQQRDKDKLALMYNNWGFGLTREFWEKRQPFVEEYLKQFCYGKEYRKRDHQGIYSWLEENGFKPLGSSQDYIKECSAILLGAVQITCFPNLARYIGARGLHFSQKMFEEWGFAEQQVYPNEVNELEELTDSVYQNLLEKIKKLKCLSLTP